MPYTFNTEQDQAAMLASIGVSSIDELFASLPPEVRFTRELNIPPAKGELELTQHMAALAAKNWSTDNSICFLGVCRFGTFGKPIPLHKVILHLQTPSRR